MVRDEVLSLRKAEITHQIRSKLQGQRPVLVREVVPYHPVPNVGKDIKGFVIKFLVPVTGVAR